MFVRKMILLLQLFVSCHFIATSQSRFELAIDVGPAFTRNIRYQNCTGRIDPAVASSVAFTYKLNSSLGLELKFSNLFSPTSYLKNGSDNVVKAYTISHILLQHLLAGMNYYVPVQRIHPYFGLLAGASYAETKETAPASSIYSFSWGFQVGAMLNLSAATALKVGDCFVITPNVYNNTSYFNVAADGSGFPSFAVGNPSRASILQWDLSIGIVIRLGKTRVDR